VPHLRNLHEDPQLSGVVYYSMASGMIKIGRANGNPKPQVIIGALGIKPNHATISMKDNGLFELKLHDPESVKTTMINGKMMPKRGNKILNHLDRICFSNSIMYVFYYPLLNEKTKLIMEQNAEDHGDDVDLKIKLAAAWSDIQNDGIQDFTTNACPGYKYV